MSKVILHDLHSQDQLQVIIDSYEGGIYQAFLCEDGTENLIWLDQDKPLKTRSLIEMRDQLDPLRPASMYLRQQSAYDEMVGLPARAADNTLMVPIFPDHLPPTADTRTQPPTP
ncbi:DUF6482 family protein [Pseudomaricurvus sp.]|uniref:DUF6482 family protein n=1 Tax=Pseudomaricurvus sp. TaxID=2004510 RepID=UPI003F6CC5D6